MELLLIRHALPVRRELEVGTADPELSQAGHAQARHLAEYLSAEAPLDALYASPLNRARQTAAPVAERFGLDVVIDDGVAEWDRHSNEYVPIEELKAADDPRWQALLRGEWTSHDESPEQFAARVVDTIEAIVARHRSERAAIVCHGGVINTYLAHVLGLGAQHSFSIRTTRASTEWRRPRVGSVRSSRSTRPPTYAAPACRSACSSADSL